MLNQHGVSEVVVMPIISWYRGDYMLYKALWIMILSLFLTKLTMTQTRPPQVYATSIFVFYLDVRFTTLLFLCSNCQTKLLTFHAWCNISSCQEIITQCVNYVRIGGHRSCFLVKYDHSDMTCEDFYIFVFWWQIDCLESIFTQKYITIKKRLYGLNLLWIMSVSSLFTKPHWYEHGHFPVLSCMFWRF